MTLDEAAHQFIKDMKAMEADMPNDAEYGKAMRAIVKQMHQIDEVLLEEATINEMRKDADNGIPKD